MPSSQYNLKKFDLRIPFFFNQKQKIVGFLRSIVRNRFHKTAEFQDILPRLTLEKEANSWKIAKKMVIFTIVCCHGNSLQHPHINAKGMPGVLLIFTVNIKGLNPKLKQILHF